MNRVTPCREKAQSDGHCLRDWRGESRAERERDTNGEDRTWFDAWQQGVVRGYLQK